MSRLKTFVLLFVLVVMVGALCCSSVYAYWHYSIATPQEIIIRVNAMVMPWEGSDSLPNDSETGTNHKSLIDQILNGTFVSGNETVNVGLNTENSYLAGEVAERKKIFWREADQLGTMDIWEDDRLNNYFDLNESSNKVSFILEFPDGSDDTYYIYTTSVDLGGRRSPNVPIGTNIYPVYRTTISRGADGKWTATLTEKGYAKSAYYKNPILGLAIDPGFDTDSWKAGELGTSTNNAVYTAIGLNIPVSVNDAGVTYYTFKNSSSRATRTVTVTSGKINVYNSNGTLVAPTSGANGSGTISFSAGANATFYIEVFDTAESNLTIN